MPPASRTRNVVVVAPGPPDRLELRQADRSPLPPGSVRVHVAAAGINFRDIAIRRGDATDDVRYPVALGSEFAGEIIELGAGVDPATAPLGRRVLGMVAEGAYADEVIVPAVQVRAIPDELDATVAATIPVAGLTASFLCSEAHVGPESKVVTWAAAGGVGCYLGAVIDHRGGRSVGITSSQAKLDAARRAGHRDVVSHRQADVVGAVRDVLGGGADVVFDSVGGPDFSRSFRMAADFGQIVLCGRSAGEPDLADSAVDFIGARRNLSLHDFNLVDYFTIRFDHVVTRLDELIGLVGSDPGRIPVTVFPLDGAADAHATLERGDNIGKFVLTT